MPCLVHGFLLAFWLDFGFFISPNNKLHALNMVGVCSFSPWLMPIIYRDEGYAYVIFLYFKFTLVKMISHEHVM